LLTGLHPPPVELMLMDTTMSDVVGDEAAVNPLADQLREDYGDQLARIVFRCSCRTDGPIGIVDGRTATDQECRCVEVDVEASFCVDITSDIAQQTVDGLRFLIEKLTAEVDRLEDDMTSGKYPYPGN
jgi:hypothetical protein